MTNNTNELRTVIINDWDNDISVLDLTDNEIKLLQWFIGRYGTDVSIECVDEMERVKF